MSFSLKALKIFSKLADHVQLLISVGTHSYAPDVRRRLRILNVMSYIVMIVTSTYIIQYLALDAVKYAPLIIINFIILAFVSTIPFAHRYHELAGAFILIITEFAALFALTAYLGRPSGIQLQYIIGASVPFLVFGIHRLRLIAVIVVIALLLHIAAWFFYSRHDALMFLDKTTLSTIYINAVTTTFLVTAIVIYYAMKLADKAETELEDLLHNILPGEIVRRLKETPDQAIADHYSEASVLFVDMVGFTPLSKKLGIQKTSEILNLIIHEFDSLAKELGVEKIKTIGDAYMAATGVPLAQEDHSRRLGLFGLGTLEIVKDISKKENIELHVRVGIASGPLMAGLVGKNKFAYDIWGDTVNLASRMESQGQINQIQVNALFREKTIGEFSFQNNGIQEIRGVGATETFLLTGRV